MTPNKDFAAWSSGFEDRLKSYVNVRMDQGIETNLKEDVPFETYDPFTYNSKGTVTGVSWRTVTQYCIDCGYIRSEPRDGEYKIYKFDMKLGYYIPQTVKELVAFIAYSFRRTYPDFELKTRFPALVEQNTIPGLPSPREICPENWKDNAEIYRTGETIPFRNGIYSIKTNKLLPRTSYVFIEHPLDVDFDPSALDCSIRSKYMDMMCGNECLFELLFEQMGYAMYARTFTVPAFVLLYGAGANGKSIVVDMLARIIGQKNVSTLSMYDMANAFALAQSEGKLINISSDSSAGMGSTNIATSDVREFIKKSTAGEAFTFNPKNKTVHTGFGPRKFVFASNVLLNFGGLDGGLARRMYTIPFDAMFKEDSSVKALFFTESAVEWFAMQALVSMLCMLHRRMDGAELTETTYSGEFLTCEAADRMKSEQMASQDNVLDWLSDELELDIQDREAVRIALNGQIELFKEYRAFCAETGRQPKARKTFHATLKTMFGVSQRRTQRNGENIYVSELA